MTEDYRTRLIAETVEQLSNPQSMKGLCRQHQEGYPLPSAQALEEVVRLARAILFPGYFGKSKIKYPSIQYEIGVMVGRMQELLEEQILAGLLDSDSIDTMHTMRLKAKEYSMKVITRLPEIRRVLGTDVVAAYNGDPAATSTAEILTCYPVIKALTNYRLAHEIQLLHVPLIPRILTEMAHSETGIDIHPGAQIGEYFTIDHGTGVVVGATCIIGKNVKLYQGVTLGARSFPLDEDGNPIKGIPRHPILEDNVVVSANATILGRVTIGHDCIVGANTWVMDDMAPATRIYNEV